MSNKEFENCDGALWSVDKFTKQDEIVTEVNSVLYRYTEKTIKPDDLGFKYHILTFKQKSDDAEILSAYIGDVKYFIDNHAKAGYNGVMIKHKSLPKKDIKELFKKILQNWDFPNKTISSVVSQF